MKFHEFFVFRALFGLLCLVQMEDFCCGFILFFSIKTEKQVSGVKRST